MEPVQLEAPPVNPLTKLDFLEVPGLPERGQLLVVEALVVEALLVKEAILEEATAGEATAEVEIVGVEIAVAIIDPVLLQVIEIILAPLRIIRLQLLQGVHTEIVILAATA